MLNFLPSLIIGLLSFILYSVNTIFWVLPIVILALLKAIVPIVLWRLFMSYLLDFCASAWVLVNTFIQSIFNRTHFNVSQSGDELSKNGWYLVLSNHQSWVDIVVLQRLLHGKIPFLKFFLKKELIYVPLLGIAWWALDFPFMKRYSQSFLRKNPQLIGADFKTTREACEKFKYKPVSVMSFIEGTRFTEEKFQKQKPPFEYLLRPKAGGIAFALDAMGEYFTQLVDVTIHYPDGRPDFSDFLCGRIKQVNIDIAVKPIVKEMIGDYVNDKQFKQGFHQWVNQLWIEKDKKLNDFNKGK